MKKLFIIGLLLLSVFLVGSCGNKETKEKETKVEDTKKEEPKKEEPKKEEPKKEEPKKEEPKKDEKPEEGDKNVNYANFLKINIGDTKENIEKLLGGKGKLKSSSSSGDKTRERYEYKVGDLELTFDYVNDKLENKTHWGHKEINPKVTVEAYSKIKKGDTLQDIEKELGVGVLNYQFKYNNKKCYYWYQDKFKHIRLVFDEDKLTDKSMSGLD